MSRCICEHCSRPQIYHFWMEWCCPQHHIRFGFGKYCDDGVLYVEDYNDTDAFFFYNVFGWFPEEAK